MALDAAMIKIAAEEMSRHLTGARVDKIFMPARDMIIMNARNEKGTKRLLISARSGMSRAHFTEQEYDNPSVPPAFCMLLRKHLQSGRIKGVRAADGERLIFVDFEALNEMGDRVGVTASIELMGRYSNFVLINAQNRVIDALKHIDAGQSDKRQIIPGIEFQPPPAQDKLSFLSTDAGTLVSAITLKSRPLSGAILDAVSGIGPVVCRELALRASSTDTDADRLDSDGRAALYSAIDAFKDAVNGGGRRLSAVYDDGVPVEFSFIPLTQYKGLSDVRFESVSELLDTYYAERDRAELLRTRSAGLKRQVNAVFERVLRRQRSREQELDSAEKADQAKLCGELLTAYLGQFSKGMTRFAAYDYYSGTTVEIPLDPQKTPVQNAQKYYRNYRKLTTARKILGELLAEGEKELEYLESVKYEVDSAVTEDEFIGIRAELKESGYLKSFKIPKGKQKKIPGFFTYRSSEGFSILAGKNNAANDSLTLRKASKRDIWFHVKNGAGSHTVVMTEGQIPGGATLTEAAAIAAFHSSFGQSGQTAVDYTGIQNVKKAPGQKPGMVTYANYKTAYVIPDAELIQSLRE